MTHEQFVIWLHGYLEISDAKTLGEKELLVIKDHLEKFFIKVTPDRKDYNIHSHECTCSECLEKRLFNKKIEIINPYQNLDWTYRSENQPIYNFPKIIC